MNADLHDAPPDGDAASVLRLRGLPFEATEADIAAFFAGFQLLEVYICQRQGRPSGEAYVRLPTADDARTAQVKLDGQHLGRRYIEIFHSSEDELNTKKAKARHVQQQGYLVKLRGLPYSATVSDVAEFFAGIPMARGLESISLLQYPNGVPTGEAFVEFASLQAREEALKRDRQHIGQRFIEVFRAGPRDAVKRGGRTGRGGRTPSAARDDMGVDAAAIMLQGLELGSGLRPRSSPWLHQSSSPAETLAAGSVQAGMPWLAGANMMTQQQLLLQLQSSRHAALQEAAYHQIAGLPTASAGGWPDNAGFAAAAGMRFPGVPPPPQFAAPANLQQQQQQMLAAVQALQANQAGVHGLNDLVSQAVFNQTLPTDPPYQSAVDLASVVAGNQSSPHLPFQNLP